MESSGPVERLCGLFEEQKRLNHAALPGTVGAEESRDSTEPNRWQFSPRLKVREAEGLDHRSEEGSGGVCMCGWFLRLTAQSTWSDASRRPIWSSEASGRNVTSHEPS